LPEKPIFRRLRQPTEAITNLYLLLPARSLLPLFEVKNQLLRTPLSALTLCRLYEALLLAPLRHSQGCHPALPRCRLYEAGISSCALRSRSHSPLSILAVLHRYDLPSKVKRG